MNNVKEAVEVRGSTLKEIEQSALFLGRSQWKNFVTDRPWACQFSGTSTITQRRVGLDRPTDENKQ